MPAGGMPDLSAAIGKLMAHPELLQMAASVLRESGGSADPAEEGANSPADRDPAGARFAGNSPPAEGSSEEAAARVASEEGTSKAETSKDTAPAGASLPAALGNLPALDALPTLLGLAGPLLSGRGTGGGKSAGHGKGIGRSTALLIALKPYLSPARCEAVDRIVEIGKLGELLERLS